MKSAAWTLLALVAVAASVASAASPAASGTLVLTIGGEAEGCRCCMTLPRGMLCSECEGPPCTCDFDFLGLPRCTSGLASGSVAR